MKKKMLLVFSVITAIVVPTAAMIADVHTATYKGSKTCGMCHKGTHKPIVEGYNKSAHSKALMKADVADAIVGDFASNTAFKKDQVAFVLGVGKRQQSYLDANYQVLPATWDVKSKSWKTNPAADGVTQCVGCHTVGFDSATKAAAQLGVGCESCHGPGSEHAAGPKKAAVVHPQDLKPAESSMICGQCHSVGKDPSGKFAYPVGYRPGDDLTKLFVDAKPTTAGRNQQYSEWVISKHAKGDSVVGCVTCHDSHDVSENPAQLKKPVNELCLGCHAKKITDLATHAPKAAAGATCATCHMPDGVHTFAKAK